MGLPVGHDYCFKCGYPVRGLPADDAGAAGAAGAAAQQPPPPPFAPPTGPPADGLTGGAQPGAPGFAPAALAFAPAAARTQVLATWQSRLAAAVIDYALVSAAVGLVIGVSGALGGAQGIWSHVGTTSRPVLILEAALWLGFGAYCLICEAIFGATLGKRLLLLRVVAYGGGRPGIGALVVRNFTKVLSGAFWFVGVPVAMVAIASNANHQRLGDRLAGTFVLRDVVTFGAPGPPR